jgi:alcohol dehydrogenase class IV
MGVGAVSQVGEEARRLAEGSGKPSALVVCGRVIGSSELLGRVTALLESAGLAAHVFAEVEPEPSLDAVDKCAAVIEEGEFGVVIGLGGGSSLDVAKVAAAIAGRGYARDHVGVGKIPGKGLPTLMVPTTSGSGSEVTPSALLSDPEGGGLKRGVVSPFMVPDASIVDAELTLTLPPGSTAASGMDVLVHALEAYVSLRANPVTDALALRSMALVGMSLRKAFANGEDLAAREQMASASLLAGICIGNAGLGLVHAIALPLGGRFGIAHGIANAVLLPYVLEFNLPSNLSKYAASSEALGENVDGLTLRERARLVIRAVRDLIEDLDIPPSLKDLGIPDSALDTLAQDAMDNKRLLATNPRKPTLDQVRTICQRAWNG